MRQACAAMRAAPLRPTRSAPIGDGLIVGRKTDPGADATRWLIERQMIGIVLLDEDGVVAECLGGLVDWVKTGQRAFDSMPFLTEHAEAIEAVAHGRRDSFCLSGVRNPGPAEAQGRSLSIHCFRSLDAPGTTLLLTDVAAIGQPYGDGEHRHGDFNPSDRDTPASREDAVIGNRSQSQFLALVSHELRTPLNVIIGNAEILRDWDPDTFTAEDLHIFAEDILDNGTFLLDHINDLLDIAKAEVGGIILDEEEVDLGLVVDGTLAAVRKLPHAGALTIEHRPVEALPQFMGDQRRLRQIVLNLLMDAVRVTPNGGSVLVRTFVGADDALTVEISYGSAGPSAAAPGAVPQSHERGNAPNDKNADSESVLGLPLAKTLIELHNGTLTLHDPPGEPARMTLRFPPQRRQDVR